MFRIFRPLEKKSELIVSDSCHQVFFRQIEGSSPWSFVESFDVVYVLQGDLVFESKNKKIKVKEKQLLTLTQNTFFRLRNDSGKKLHLIHLSYSESSLSGLRIKERSEVFDVDCDILKRFLSKSCLNLLSQSELGRVDVKRLEVIFSEVSEKIQNFIDADYFCLTPLINFSKNNRLIDEVLVKLQENLSSSNMLRKIAEEKNINNSYLSRLFKKELQISPSTCHQLMKVRRSQFLIQEKGEISRVTYELGFSDQSHFNKTFKKLLLLSPTDYKFGVLDA